jgi:hypothetical protein
MSTFTPFDPVAQPLGSLVSAIFSGSSGVAVVADSVSARYGTADGQPSISFYDGSLAALNIGAGLLLTSGDSTPPLENTESSYGVGLDNATSGEASLQATVDAAFTGAGDVQDVTTLQFTINVTDPNATGLRFDVVFGSDEYPEYSNTTFVDVAGVYVNGIDYALFNANPKQPLSVIDDNLTAGNFRDNQGNALPIEYDGVSTKLQVTAPIHMGLNTVKIAIADTGDSIYDSGIFVSGLQAVNYAGYGLAQQVPVTGGSQVTDTADNQVYQGDALNNVVLLLSGQDVVDGGAGIDKVKYTFGLGGISNYSWDGHVLTVQSGPNSSTLVNVERVQLGDGSLYALDTSIGQDTLDVYALLFAGFGHGPDQSTLSGWLAQADTLLQASGNDLGDVAQAMIEHYASGISNIDFVSYLFQQVIGRAPSAQEVQTYSDMIGVGQTFATQGDLLAYAAMDGVTTIKLVGVIGSIQALDASAFA